MAGESAAQIQNTEPGAPGIQTPRGHRGSKAESPESSIQGPEVQRPRQQGGGSQRTQDPECREEVAGKPLFGNLVSGNPASGFAAATQYKVEPSIQIGGKPGVQSTNEIQNTGLMRLENNSVWQSISHYSLVLSPKDMRCSELYGGHRECFVYLYEYDSY